MPNGKKGDYAEQEHQDILLKHLQLANVKQAISNRHLANSQVVRPTGAGPQGGNIQTVQTNQDILLKHLQLLNVIQTIFNGHSDFCWQVARPTGKGPQAGDRSK